MLKHHTRSSGKIADWEQGGHYPLPERYTPDDIRRRREKIKAKDDEHTDGIVLN